MPSLDYIEKLTGIKEEWIQNLKETESALVLAVQLPPQEHICPHCKAATRRIKGYYTRLIKHSPLLHKELHLLYRQRRYICSCGHTFNEEPLCLSVFPNLFLASTSHAPGAASTPFFPRSG